MPAQTKIFFAALFTIAFSCANCQGPPGEYYRLARTADSLFKLKEYKKSAFAYSDAFSTNGWKGFAEDRYNAARAWAMAGYPDSAIFNLEKIVYRLGYYNITQINNEKNFASLSSHRKWKPLMARLRSNADSVAAKDAMLDKTLIKRLDSLVKVDQKWRKLATRYYNNSIPKDSIDENTIHINMGRTDSANTSETHKIFYKYGFPNYDLVGIEGSGNFWLLVQHQDNYPEFQDSVLVKMKIEAQMGKASWQNYAYLVDRVQVNFGRPQVYGTQMRLNHDQTSYEPSEVTEPEKLNERRKEVGLSTIEEYIALMNNLHYGSLKEK